MMGEGKHDHGFAALDENNVVGKSPEDQAPGPSISGRTRYRRGRNNPISQEIQGMAYCLFKIGAEP